MGRRHATAELQTGRRRLLAWYDRHQRLLPWRATPVDPYATLVSETMLQQTQVATVIPYYERFMRRFPTVESLADAEIGEVLSCWAGLGYYRRCHRLHRAARSIVERFSGTVPPDPESLMTLSGVGPYTAGAVASIAYGEPVPAVDGNVRRVLTRVLGDAPASPRNGDGRVWSFAAEWMSRRRPGDFNQALMELGARVCTPRRPDCAACPLRTGCASAGSTRARGTTRSTRKPPSDMTLVTVAIQHGSHLIYRRRPYSGLWSGLWEWPSGPLSEGGDPRGAAWKLATSIAPDGCPRPRHLGTLTHVLTHRRVTIYAFHVVISARPGRTAGRRWLGLRARNLPMSRAQVKLLAMLEEAGSPNTR